MNSLITSALFTLVWAALWAYGMALQMRAAPEGVPLYRDKESVGVAVALTLAVGLALGTLYDVWKLIPL